MIRKDLNSQNQYDAGVALSGLSCFISADLSRDLANDIMTLVSLLALAYFYHFVIIFFFQRLLCSLVISCLFCVYAQMSSTKPYLRMKAVLMMYKVFLRYPEALRPAFPKLKEKLEDSDPGMDSQLFFQLIC